MYSEKEHLPLLKGPDLSTDFRVMIYCVNKIRNKEKYEFQTPLLEEVHVIVPFNIDALEEYSKKFVQHFDPEINVVTELDDPNCDYNAAYHFKEHKISINPYKIFNSITETYLNSETDPQTTVELILAHELGHASKEGREVYPNDHWQLIDHINEFLSYTRSLRIVGPGSGIKNMTFDQLLQLEEICEEILPLYRSFQETELNAEIAAWKYGRRFIPSELESAYNKDNLSVIKGYLKEHEVQYKRMYLNYAHVKKKTIKITKEAKILTIRKASNERNVQSKLKKIEKELLQVNQIHASSDTIDELVKWVSSGKVPFLPLPRPLEQGLLFLGEHDYVVFNRLENIVQIAWKKNGNFYSGFKFNLQTEQISNVGTYEKIEVVNDDIIQPFFKIAYAYIGSMAFITKNIRNEKAVSVKIKNDQRIYKLDHRSVKFENFSTNDMIEGQLIHFANYSAAWNYELKV